MINEISQNMLGTTASQPRRESGAVSRTQDTQAVSVSNAPVSKGQEFAKVREPAAPAVDEKKLEEMVDDLNGLAQSVQRQLKFSIDAEDGKVYVKVVDAETKDIIREIPSEEVRNMQRHMKEVSEMIFQKGENRSLLFKGEA
ncbi:MAG: flagellar protein FlaG [Gammaproteobacteria bacterium]|nr:flagellar protein FlaG [Gammaproteobacteria bacterium]